MEQNLPENVILLHERRNEMWDSLQDLDSQTRADIFSYVFGYLASSPILSDFLDALEKAMGEMKIWKERR